MRLYAYISESVKLGDLVPIVETSKLSNAAHGVAGLLSYSYGHYFQVIQGEEAEISALMNNIRKDTRHQNITEILNVEIDEPIFSDWTMNLVPLLKRNESFINFIGFLNNNINLLSSQQKRLMTIFHSVIDRKIPSAKEANPFKPLSYSIMEWPDFDVVEASSCLLSLCGALMNNPTHFRKLIIQEIYGPEEDVRKMLNQLNKAGYLKVTQVQKLGQARTEERRGYRDIIRIPGRKNLTKAHAATS